jgi:hypothetical protein
VNGGPNTQLTANAQLPPRLSELFGNVQTQADASVERVIELSIGGIFQTQRKGVGRDADAGVGDSEFYCRWI